MKSRWSLKQLDRRFHGQRGRARSRGPQRVAALSFDHGQPIRLEATPAGVARVTAAPGRPSRAASSRLWRETVNELPRSTHPFSMESYDEASPAARGSADQTGTGLRPDDPDAVGPATGLAVAPSVADDAVRVDDPDAPQSESVPERPHDRAPSPPLRGAAPIRSPRAVAAEAWDQASDEAFERGLQDASRRASTGVAETPPPSDSAQSPQATPTRPVSAASAHDVFDRMASAMQHAQSFDLGRHEVQGRLDAFEDEILNPRRAEASTASAPNPATQAALNLDDTDVVAQLAIMEAHSEPSPTPPTTSATPASAGQTQPEVQP